MRKNTKHIMQTRTHCNRCGSPLSFVLETYSNKTLPDSIWITWECSCYIKDSELYKAGHRFERNMLAAKCSKHINYLAKRGKDALEELQLEDDLYDFLNVKHCYS